MLLQHTWLAFTPCARATCATDAPGCNVSSTIRRFSATDRRLRGSLLTTIRSEVSTYSPSGHFPMCPHEQSSFTTHTPPTRPEPDAYKGSFKILVSFRPRGFRRACQFKLTISNQRFYVDVFRRLRSVT